MFSGRREQERLAGLRAEVESLRSRLDSDVATLDPADDPVARQALNDASERANAAGSLLSRSQSAAELDVAKRIVLEGLYATRVLRQRRGLPLGPDLPVDPRTVDAPTEVQVAGDTHVAHPEYHPDRPFFFGGGPLRGPLSGQRAPGGYYRTPFWQKALAVGGAVMGAEALGGLLGGGGGWHGEWDGDGYGGDSDGGGDGGGGDW